MDGCKDPKTESGRVGGSRTEVISAARRSRSWAKNDSSSFARAMKMIVPDKDATDSAAGAWKQIVLLFVIALRIWPQWPGVRLGSGNLGEPQIYPHLVIVTVAVPLKSAHRSRSKGLV